jgi:hypothetical protein
MNFYAGIGARATPPEVLKHMTTVANNLYHSGFILRSGGAAGADSAFEAGVEDPDKAEIYLPWRGFNGNKSYRHDISSAALEMAEKYHPAWNRCSPAARKFHARNCYQLLGLGLDTPVRFVLCWTPGGAMAGGTGQALRIAVDYGIRIFNMASDDWGVPFNELTLSIMKEEPNWDFEGAVCHI